jgi:hypothetical protein
MPIDTIAVLASVVLGFAIFAAVLLWGDFKTGPAGEVTAPPGRISRTGGVPARLASACWRPARRARTFTQPRPSPGRRP